MPDFGDDVAFTTFTSLQGLVFALDAGAFEVEPDWTRIDTSYNVQEVSIRRGRTYEFDRTQPGTMVCRIIDRDGSFNPNNVSGAFTGLLEPRTQVAFGVQNAVTGLWSTRFRGHVERVAWSPYRTKAYANVTIECVGALATIARTELMPGGSGPVRDFGDAPLREGDIYYPADAALNAVQTRCVRVLDECGWSGIGTTGDGLRQIFTGNVGLWEKTYPARTSALAVILEAVEAEFPGVGNVFENRSGEIAIHGRKARFDPVTTATDTDWDFTDWFCGDNIAVAVDPSTVVKISPPLDAFRDDSNLYTDTFATWDGQDPRDFAAQHVIAATTSNFGLMTWSAESLLTRNGEGGTTATEECIKFATYYSDNYSVIRTRVGQLTFKPHRPTDTRAAATWALLCGIDISHRIHIKTTDTGGGGFDDNFFVEGITETHTQLNDEHNMIVMTLDVSPEGYWSLDPWDDA